MRSSEIDGVLSGELDVATPGAMIDLRGSFPSRFMPKVIVNVRMLLPTKRRASTFR